MPPANSPLRYPGGKAVLSGFLSDVIIVNGLQDGTYIEPYAGGAGAALKLLFAEYVNQIILNDADPCIYAFWNTILNRTDDFLLLIEKTPITIKEWKAQRNTYRNWTQHTEIEVAFATFYLNRCNRSGIIANGGPIGGYEQENKWKIDARFNKEGLIDRINKIKMYKDRIKLYNLDAIDFLVRMGNINITMSNTLVYLDPPYYKKGNKLYLNYYEHGDHAQLANFIKKQNTLKWLMTYDNVREIESLYYGYNFVPFNISYSAYKRSQGNELLIYSEKLIIPYKPVLK